MITSVDEALQHVRDIALGLQDVAGLVRFAVRVRLVIPEG